MENGGITGAGQTAAALLRLKALAESGDREAMILMREAVRRGPPIDFRMKFANTPATDKFMETLSGALAGLWTAHLWEIHGYENNGLKFIKACHRSLVDENGKTTARVQRGPDGDTGVLSDLLIDKTSLGCGFRLRGKTVVQKIPVETVARTINLEWGTHRPKGVRVFEVYNHEIVNKRYYRRKPEDFYIVGALFYPVWGDDAFLKNAYMDHVNARSAGLVKNATSGDIHPSDLYSANMLLTLPWLEHYAVENNRGAELAASDREAEKWQRRDDERRRGATIAFWESQMAEFRKAPKTFDTYQLSISAGSLGGEYWTKYQSLLEEHRPAAKVSAPIGGNAATYNAGERVEVRAYDRSGTYQGSTTTSAFWADVMKMTSSPAR